MANTIEKGNATPKEAVHFHTRDSISKQNREEINEGFRDTHGTEGAQKVRVLDAVKRFNSISEDKAAREVRSVGIVNKVLDVTAVSNGGESRLTGDLAGAEHPRECMLEGVSKAARKDFVKDRANGDGTIV